MSVYVDRTPSDLTPTQMVQWVGDRFARTPSAESARCTVESFMVTQEHYLGRPIGQDDLRRYPNRFLGRLVLAEMLIEKYQLTF